MAITYNDNERVQTLADAVYVLIARGGIHELSLRRIGAQAGVSAGSIINHFGSKERALPVCCSILSKQHLQRLDERILDHGVLGCASTCADDVVDARVWLGITELGRSHERIAYIVADHRATRVDMIARALAHSASPDQLTALMACFDGLDQAVTALEDPLRWEFARAAAASFLDRITPEWRDLGEGNPSYFETWAAARSRCALSRRA